jgi:hypothetical protein
MLAQLQDLCLKSTIGAHGRHSSSGLAWEAFLLFELV